MAFQNPGVLTEGEVLQLRGPDTAVSNGAIVSRWRIPEEAFKDRRRRDIMVEKAK
jgi:hypothetical protein